MSGKRCSLPLLYIHPIKIESSVVQYYAAMGPHDPNAYFEGGSITTAVT